LSENLQLVRDVIVQTITRGIPFSEEVFPTEPPIDEPVELGRGLWIGSLGLDTVNMVFDACGQRGLKFDQTWRFPSHYCFVREQIVSGVPSIKWDEDGELQKCINLSRLIHPTTISTRFSARLIYQNDTSDILSKIVPLGPRGMGDSAWIKETGRRDWLTNNEARELAGLVAVYDFNSMPPRVRRAMNYFQYACLTYHPDVRLTLVVTGLEALANTSRGRRDDVPVTAQFTKRIEIISHEVGMPVSKTCLGKAYGYRSSVVHGQEQGINAKFNKLSEVVETLLRKIVRKCVEDLSFSRHFENVEAIQKMYPL